MLRIAVTSVAVYAFALCRERDMEAASWWFGGVALLFNPIIPIHGNREAWRPLDVAAGVGFLIMFVRHLRSRRRG